MGFCVCSMYCYAMLCVLSKFVIFLVGNRELFALICLYSLCLLIVMRLFNTVPWVGLQCVIVIVVFSDHIHFSFAFLQYILGIVFTELYCLLPRCFEW